MERPNQSRFRDGDFLDMKVELWEGDGDPGALQRAPNRVIQA